MKNRSEYMRNLMRELHDKRHAMGLCIYCSCIIDNVEYKTCAACRAKSREATARHREMIKVQAEQERAMRKASEPLVPTDHKCWTCEWSRLEGDRFFCPFIEGSCVKEEKNED